MNKIDEQIPQIMCPICPISERFSQVLNVSLEKMVETTLGLWGDLRFSEVLS